MPLLFSELSPELQLLIRCARVSHDEASLVGLRDLMALDIDWNGVLEAAAKHQVMPLVANSIGRAAEAAPAWLRTDLDEFYRRHTARSLRLAGVLVEVLDVLEGRGIAAFPYKGPALAAVAYGNVLLRTFADLDILVPKTEYIRAKEAIEDVGFVHNGEPMNDRSFLLWKSAHSFSRGGVYVDLQWGSTGIEGLSVPIGDEFWKNDDTIRIAGKEVRAIPSEDLLLFVCAHGSRHHWDRLKWVCDVAALVGLEGGFDWDHVARRADQVGAGRVLRLSLLLAEAILDTKVPEVLEDEVRADRVAGRLAEEAVERLFFERANPALSQYRYDLEMRDRWRDRLRYLGFRFFQPTDEDRAHLHLPQPVQFLYPILVPLRRGWRFIVGVVRKKADNPH